MSYSRTGNYKLGIFTERENRFVVLLQHEDQIYRCHLPNPGRMVLLLIENETILIFEPAPRGSSRKTDGTVIGIKSGSNVINLDTMMFSKLLPQVIENTALPIFKNWKILSSETTIGNHRFDFVLEIDNQPVITEVKSTTRVVDDIACFPDAVSKRATSHIKSLHKLSLEGKETMVIFTVYQQADRFQPCLTIDPSFSNAFYEVIKEIEFLALQITGTWINHTEIKYDVTGTIPIVEQPDRG